MRCTPASRVARIARVTRVALPSGNKIRVDVDLLVTWGGIRGWRAEALSGWRRSLSWAIMLNVLWMG